jgi:hypothetical protein
MPGGNSDQSRARPQPIERHVPILNVRLYRTPGEEFNNPWGSLRTTVASEACGVCALRRKEDTSPPWPWGFRSLEVNEMFALDRLGDCMSGYKIREMKSGELNHALEDDMLFNVFVVA